MSKDNEYKNGPWRVRNTQTSFLNPWIAVESSDVIHPDGTAGTYGVVRYAHLACGVLPIDDEGYTWLVGQHRFPFDQYSWELPEGGGKQGVDPQQSARREMEEETGWTARHFLPLGEWHLSNSVSDEVAFGYLAWDLDYVGASPEPSEALTLKRVPFSKLLARVRSGEVKDAFTHLMVMRAYDMARNGELSARLTKLLSGAGEA